MKPTIDPQRRGRRIRAKWLEQVKQSALYGAGIRTQPPLDLVETPAGPLLRLAGDLLVFELAYLPSGTIAARSGTLPTLTFPSGSVTLLKLNATANGTVTQSISVTAHNPLTVAVAANKLLILARVLGIRLIVGSFDC